MAALTLSDLMNRSSANQIIRGAAKGIATTDFLGAVIPIRTFQGPSIAYQRERSLGTAAFIPDSGAIGAATNGADDLVTVPVRRVASDLDVDSLVDDLTNGSEMGGQILKRLKSTWRIITQKVATGGNTTGFTMSDNFQGGAYVDAITAYSAYLDSGRYGNGSLKYTHTGTFLQFRAPGDAQFGDQVACAADGSYTLYSSNKSKWITVTLDVSDASANATREITFTSNTYEFDGLNRVISPAMVAASGGADGDAMSFNVLDQLMSLEKVRSNRAFIMNSKLVFKFLSSLRALGGANPEHVRLPGIGADTIAYRGVPILENDWIPSTEAKGAATTLSSVYLASLDSSEGLFLGVPGTGLDEVDVDGDPRRSNVMGFRIEKIGALEGAAHRRTRVQWYGALGLGSDLALARASEIITL